MPQVKAVVEFTREDVKLLLQTRAKELVATKQGTCTCSILGEAEAPPVKEGHYAIVTFNDMAPK